MVNLASSGRFRAQGPLPIAPAGVQVTGRYPNVQHPRVPAGSVRLLVPRVHPMIRG